MEDPNATLASYGVEDKSTVYMELLEAQALPPGASPGGYLMSAAPGDGSGAPYANSPPPTKKQTRARRMFSAEEVEALVDAVDMFGTQWARIHSSLGGLVAERSQVCV